MATDSADGFRLPVPDWIRAYRKDWIRPDAIAGLTAAAVVIPKAMAYATIAGLPVQVGLNPGVLAMVQNSLLGETLGRERMFFDLEQAVAKYQSMPAQSRAR